MPQDLLAQPEASKGTDLLAGKDLLASSNSAAPKAPEKDESFSGGMKRGFLERGTGVDQMLNQIGVGGALPVFRNGKLAFGLPPNEELAQQEKELEAQGEGTGFKGAVAEALGDPVNLIPTGGVEGKIASTFGKEAAKKYAMPAAAGIQSALSGAMSATKDKGQTVAQRLENTGISALEGLGTGKALDALGRKAMGMGKPTGEVVAASPLNKALNQLGVRLTGKEDAQEIWEKIQTAVKDKANEIADRAAPGSAASQVWPVGVSLAASKMYDATRQAGGILYAQAKAHGAKLQASASGLLEDIDGLIADMHKDAPFQSANPKFGTALKTFQTIREGIANGGEEVANEKPWDKVMRLMQHGDKPEETVSGDKLIDLDQALNEHFGRSGGGGESSRAFSKLQNKVNETIQKMDPEFGKSYQKAKNYWRQNVIQNFEENPVLAKHWKPEDYEAYKALEKGITLPPALKARVNGLLDNIKDPLALDELKNSLPPEMYDSVRSAKFLQLMDKAGLNAKLIGDDKNYTMLAKSLANKPEQLQALDAIKTFVEQMNERGIGRELTADELKKSDKLLDRSMRTAFSVATGHKLYALKHTLEAMTGKESPNAIQGKLSGMAKEAAKGAPRAAYEPTAGHKVVSKVLATEEGADNGEGNDIPHITINKNYDTK
jgi:hypothetical protein